MLRVRALKRSQKKITKTYYGIKAKNVSVLATSFLGQDLS
jgi:hypothetical protein